MHHVNGIVGNSSSGILEAPYLKKLWSTLEIDKMDEYFQKYNTIKL